jgi:hypothetical protein
MLANPARLGDPNFPPNLAIAPSSSKHVELDDNDDGSLFSSLVCNDDDAAAC